MYTNNDLLFPHHIIPSLKTLRGDQWQHLIERVVALPETHEETLAFMLLMVRLNGCMACETDSYRAMRGCLACSQQTLRRFKGDDEELMDMYRSALDEIRDYASHHPQFNIIQDMPQRTSIP